jgi:hypothetical protein
VTKEVTSWPRPQRCLIACDAAMCLPKLNIGYRFNVGLQLTENKAM